MHQERALADDPGTGRQGPRASPQRLGCGLHGRAGLPVQGTTEPQEGGAPSQQRAAVTSCRGGWGRPGEESALCLEACGVLYCPGAGRRPSMRGTDPHSSGALASMRAPRTTTSGERDPCSLSKALAVSTRSAAREPGAGPPHSETAPHGRAGGHRPGPNPGGPLPKPRCAGCSAKMVFSPAGSRVRRSTNTAGRRSEKHWRTCFQLRGAALHPMRPLSPQDNGDSVDARKCCCTAAPPCNPAALPPVGIAPGPGQAQSTAAPEPGSTNCALPRGRRGPGLHRAHSTLREAPGGGGGQ